MPQNISKLRYIRRLLFPSRLPVSLYVTRYIFTHQVIPKTTTQQGISVDNHCDWFHMFQIPGGGMKSNNNELSLDLLQLLLFPSSFPELLYLNDGKLLQHLVVTDWVPYFGFWSMPLFPLARIPDSIPTDSFRSSIPTASLFCFCQRRFRRIETYGLPYPVVTLVDLTLLSPVPTWMPYSGSRLSLHNIRSG